MALTELRMADDGTIRTRNKVDVAVSGIRERTLLDPIE